MEGHYNHNYRNAAMTLPTMDTFRKLLWTSRFPIRWGDMDAYNHVNNTVYFRYMEQARIEWLESQNHKLSPTDTSLVIVNASCTFHVPMTYPGSVEVRMFAGKPGRSSIPTYYELRIEGNDLLYADGAAKIVWTDPVTGKSAPIPEPVRHFIDQPEGAA